MNLIRKLFFAAAILISSLARAQFAQTDEFNYCEDQSTHNFSTSGWAYFCGQYSCPGDNSFRLGSCANGVGGAAIDVVVNPGCDSIRLDFLIAVGGPGAVHVNAVSIGYLPYTTANLCNYTSLMIPNAATISASGFITLTVMDTLFGCSGDIQLCRVKVYSTPGTPTGIPDQDVINQFKIFPNPAQENVHIVFTANEAATFQITLANMLGQTVKTLHGNSIAGQNNIKLNLEKLSKGIYQTLFVHDEVREVKKLVVE